MKRVFIISLCIVMLLGIFAPLTMAGTELPDVNIMNLKFNKIKDVPKNAWYHDQVKYVFVNGLFAGVSDTEFAPNKPMTRAEFVQVLANLEGVDAAAVAFENIYSDVKSSDWFAPVVIWASKNGVAAGSGSGKFDPNAPISREQMCVMLVNYVAAKNKFAIAVEEPESAFADGEEISTWAANAVKICQMADIINGKLNNIFDPQAMAERSHVASIFHKFHQKYGSQI